MFRFLIALLYFVSRVGADELVTNPFRHDGFGCQFQSIIYSMIYAELMHKKFVYTPFAAMAHNYDKDPDFLQKKEWLVNLIDYFPVNEKSELQLTAGDLYIRFFEANVEAAAKTWALKKLKEIFRANKRRSDYFDERYFNIAVHIRRHNSEDVRIEGTNTPDGVYLEIIEALRKKYALKNPLFHIYSQGDEARFREIYKGNDLVFHIDEPIEETFPALVFADVLVISRSSFSYSAALLSEGAVYYMRFWHSPLPGWKKVDLLRNLLRPKKSMIFSLIFRGSLLTRIASTRRPEQVGEEMR